MSHAFKVLVLFTLVAIITACSYPKAEPANLYQKLGETSGITKIVDNFVIQISKTQQIKHYFQDVDIALFRERLIEQLCVISDGPCKYEGLDMATSHEGLGITDADFNTVVRLLRQAMNQAEVPYTTQNALLERLAPMHKDITYQ